MDSTEEGNWRAAGGMREFKKQRVVEGAAIRAHFELGKPGTVK
jgi:hypothetical protein